MKTNPQPGVSAYIAASMVLAVALLTGCAPSTGPAAAEPTCQGSLQGLVDDAAPGAVVEAAGGCVYRETVTIGKPIILKAAPGGSEIRGSEVWDDAAWSQQGSTWISGKTVPPLATDGGWKCEPGSSRCLWPEQVFVDGTQLTQVAVGTTPGAGQFSLDAGRHVILGESPISRTVEVTVRENWVRGAPGGAGVTIDGFTMKHAAGDGINNNANDDWTVKNGDYSYSHTSDVLLKRATGMLAAGNKIHHAGQKGVAGNTVDLTLQDNEIYANNTEGFDPSWNAGGVKVSSPKAVTFDGNTVYDNRGNGLWLDVPIDAQALVVRDNRVHHNDSDGIRSEVTDDDVQIYDNVVWENGWARGGSGIAVNASHDNHVYDNVVAWNKNGIRVMNPVRTDVHPAETEYDFVYNVEVDHNDILMDRLPDRAYALGWLKSNPGGNLYDPAANNRGHDNRYFYPVPENLRDRYAWDERFASLDAFNGTPGEEGGVYLSETEKNRVLAANGIPGSSRLPDATAPSIAITTPAEGATYVPNQAVYASYSCNDEQGGSGVESCQGPVADGAAIETGRAGSYGFTVTARDMAGNTTSLTHAYAVSPPKCTITGTPANEVISGTPANDTICAGDGRDTIKGLAGNDTLRGEGGNDTLLGGTGDDAIDGGTGTDTASYAASLTAVSASLATNTVTGEGSDTLVGVESLVGSSKADTLTGSGLGDTLTGGGGNDTARGGPGNDKVVGSGGADSLYGEDGNDTVNSKDGVKGNDLLDWGAGTDTKVSDTTEKSIVGFP
jgi:Ca2+-binding RTX toxin-like protein